MDALEEFKELLTDVAFIALTNQWRMVEIELARMSVQEPEAFSMLQEAWADDGWLVQPPWAAAGES